MESVFGIWQLAMTLSEMKDKLITITLARHNGRRDLAAKDLGIAKNTMFRLINERLQRDK